MSDSERPNPLPPGFEVPDLELELEPVRSLRQAAAPPSAATRAEPAVRANAGTSTSPHDALFGSSFDFGDELAEFEFERNAQPNLHLASDSRAPATSGARAETPGANVALGAAMGRALDPDTLTFDPHAIAILADYGDPPASAAHTLGYAYRVFARQRVLKQQLVPIAAECEQAQNARETTLAELASVLRPQLEHAPDFRPFLGALLAIEQRAAARGNALNSINAELGAQHAELDAELGRLAGLIEAERHAEGEAQREHETCDANAKRADAKLKRVQIEMRAVRQVAEQKLGPGGGPMPEPEAAQLASLSQRAAASEPEVAQARAQLEQAEQALDRARARLETLQQSERQVLRNKQALGGAYQRELAAHTRGVSDTELEQRAALADLARAVLAGRPAIEVPAAWLERVRAVSEHADQLLVRREMQRQAISAYDAEGARKGVRLACTAAALLLILLLFRLFF